MIFLKCRYGIIIFTVGGEIADFWLVGLAATSQLSR